MAYISTSPTTIDKLSILSQDSQYDIACACGTKNNTDHRTRTTDGKWLYPVTLPNGGQSIILKTLVSNVCSNDCGYCPLRAGRDVRRCTVEPEKLANVFLDYYRSGKAMGIFLSSGVCGSADVTMERINAVARILRNRNHFKGYIHLKIIPGASDAAIEDSISLASTVSVNIETPGENHFVKLSATKSYIDDVIRPIKKISQLTAKGSRYERVGQVTQFIVGASDEADREIVNYSGGLYKRLGMRRIYFSAYQRGLGKSGIPGECSQVSNSDLLTREHRLYQADWLMRKYGFDAGELHYGGNGNLPLDIDPKENWARNHPEFFPINLNSADKMQLIRIPGVGPGTVEKIIKMRMGGGRIRRIDDLGKVGKRLNKAREYVSV